MDHGQDADAAADAFEGPMNDDGESPPATTRACWRRAWICYIAEKLDSVDGYGRSCVRRFVEGTQISGDRALDPWQQDAFGQVEAWLRAVASRD
jgi:hypothetical protein